MNITETCRNSSQDQIETGLIRNFGQLVITGSYVVKRHVTTSNNVLEEISHSSGISNKL